MAQWVGFACYLDGNWMSLGLGCIHGSFCLSTPFGIGPVNLALQLSSMSLALAC